MVIPKSLRIVIGLLVAGFILSLTISIHTKGKEYNYQKIGGVAMSDNPSQPGSNGTNFSYQDSANPHYALPPTQKVVTYCVIDGRLVDS
jgi:hypothetical protein